MSESIASQSCPFLKGESRQTIICEGIIDNAEIQTGFDTITAKAQYKKLFCGDCYFRCPIAIEANRIQKRYTIFLCKNNDGVECVDNSKCGTCGWNPAVAKERLSQYYESKRVISRGL